MAKKEVDVIIKTMEINLNFYAIANHEGKFSKHITAEYKHIWVDDIKHAKIYLNRGSACTQITYIGENYHQYPVPMLVEIISGSCNYIDQSERVAKSIYDRKLKGRMIVIKNLQDKILRLTKELGDNSHRVALMTTQLNELVKHN